ESSAAGTLTGKPVSMVADSDGSLWVLEQITSGTGLYGAAPGEIAHVTGGTVTEYPLDGIQVYSDSADKITIGADGNVWFAESGFGVGRMTPTGTVTTFSLTQSPPSSITMGPDGNVWFTEWNRVGKITPTGTITTYPLRTL